MKTVLAVLLCIPSLASAQQCAPRPQVIATLAKTHSEQQRGAGFQNSSAATELWITPDGATWTILLTRPNGVSCIIASGTDWITVAPAPAGTLN